MTNSLTSQLSNNQLLNNKVALITGSTSGIGLATAHKLATQGADIVLHGLLPEEQGKDLANQLEVKYGIRVLFSAANIANPEEINQLFRAISETFGRLDVVVNNAGIQFTERLENFPTQKWDAIMAVNLSAAFHITKQALPLMKKNHWGRVINIASVHGLVGSANKSAYVAAKHGLIGLTKVAAIEEAENKITVNAICPGWVETPLINDQIEQIAKNKHLDFDTAKKELITNKQPLPTMAHPGQIGDLVLFLCSDAAAGITGASLPIDGAWTAQ